MRPCKTRLIGDLRETIFLQPLAQRVVPPRDVGRLATLFAHRRQWPFRDHELQGADLVILDESFAALDPETLRRCLRAACERAQALLVIAHP